MPIGNENFGKLSLRVPALVTIVFSIFILAVGSPEHEKAKELLASSLEVIKANVELVAMTLFHTMFKMDPQLLNKFPFKDDEWSRAVFEDHERQYKEQPAKSWFIMFR